MKLTQMISIIRMKWVPNVFYIKNIQICDLYYLKVHFKAFFFLTGLHL